MLIAVPFVVVITGFVIIGLAATSQSTSSAWVSWLAQQLGATGTVLGLGLQAAIDLSRWATHKLGQHFAGIERLTVAWLAGLFQYASQVMTFLFLWPIKLVQVTLWLLDVEIPRLIHALPNAATQIVRQTIVRVQRIEHTVIRLPKLSRKQAESLIGAAVAAYITPYLLPLRWLRQHFHALTAVLPHTLPIPFGRTIADIKARLRRLEHVGVGTIATAALIAALARLGLGFLRCGNVKKVGKSICGMNAGLLESLLADGLTIFSAVSIVELAHELLSIEDDLIAGVKFGFTELRDL